MNEGNHNYCDNSPVSARLAQLLKPMPSRQSRAQQQERLKQQSLANEGNDAKGFTSREDRKEEHRQPTGFDERNKAEKRHDNKQPVRRSKATQWIYCGERHNCSAR